MSYNCPNNMLGDREPPPKKEKRKRKHEDNKYIWFSINPNVVTQLGYYVQGLIIPNSYWMYNEPKQNTNPYQTFKSSNDY